jgi:spore germination cell wall hydrolase CwlJ-like protein
MSKLKYIALFLGVYFLYRGTKMALTDKEHQIDIMARTAWGEARGEGISGMQAVLNVIMNRAKIGGWYGLTPAEVCLKKSQFSCWNKNDPNYAKITSVTMADESFANAVDLATMAYNNQLPDITNGATNYLALKSLSKTPDWVEKLQQVAVVGKHTFYA